LQELLDELPEVVAKQCFTHTSWIEHRSDSYERLAFLGDSVLSLSISTHLYPRLDDGTAGIGRLTKVRAQTVSGAACRNVAQRLGIPDYLRAQAPKNIGRNVTLLAKTERVLASVIEAVIGACYLEFGYERTAASVVQAFEPEIAEALERPVDFKSTLQERLARSGTTVSYQTIAEIGPSHARTFEVQASVGDRYRAIGQGHSKKDAEQVAARQLLDMLDESEITGNKRV
jgi:ribonuclease-3